MNEKINRDSIYLLPEILKLSVPERILFVETIWDSIASESNKDMASYELNPEHIAIFEEGMEAYIKNPNEESVWEYVKQDCLTTAA